MSDATDFETIILEISEGVGTVTLNRPGSLNAMSEKLMDELHSALESLARDPAVRCVLLQGHGTAFSAGGDVNMIIQRQEASLQARSSADWLLNQQRLLVERGQSSVLLATMPKPTIAALHGHVVGGAFALALATDIRIAREDTLLRTGFARRGLSGDFGITFLLRRAVGDARARALLLEDPVIPAAEALELGLVTRVEPEAGFDKVVRECATRLAKGPTLAFGRMKANLARLDGSMGDSIEYEALSQRVISTSIDVNESSQAFLEERAPTFHGI